MRCREVEELWDDVRGGCQASVKEAVQGHLAICPPCQELYEEYEGIAYCLGCLPQPEPSCDLAQKVVEHIAAVKHKFRATPVVLTSAQTPIGKLYVGFKEDRIAYIGVDAGEPFDLVRERI